MMAVHAFDVYEAAERYADLESALAGFSLSAGFTRRRGERRKAFSLSVEDFVAQALRRPRAGSVALVFGNERTGLTDEELGLCSLAAHIPSSEAFPSLNLAQAVQVACYELRRQAIGERDGSAVPVSRAQVEESVERIAGHLREIGFFKVTRDRRALGLSQGQRGEGRLYGLGAALLRVGLPQGCRHDPRAGRGRPGLEHDVLGEQLLGPAGEDEAAMHDIAELADVAGPVVVAELVDGLSARSRPVRARRGGRSGRRGRRCPRAARAAGASR